MQTSLTECPVCSFEYDEVSKVIPKTLNCGHTVCLNCVSDIIRNEDIPKCPLDRKRLEQTNAKEFPTNLLVFDIVNTRRKEKTESCLHHQEPNIFLRMSDKAKICAHCFYLDRSGQDIRHLQEIKEQTDLRISLLQSVENDLLSYQEKIRTQLEDKKNIILTDVHKSFEEMHAELFKREESLMAEVRLFFAHQKRIAEQRLSSDCGNISDIQQQLRDLLKEDLTDDFFKALEKKFELVPEDVKTAFEGIRADTENVSMTHAELEGVTTLQVVNDFLDIKNIDGEIKISPKSASSSTFTSKETLLQLKQSLAETKSVRLTNSHLSVPTEFFESFFALWNQMKLVTSLSVEFPCNNRLVNADLSALDLYKHLDMQQITDFALDLQACENVTSGALNRLFETFVARTKNIKSMTLALSNIAMAEGDDEIGSVLELVLTHIQDKLNGLKSFALHLQENPVKDNDFSGLIDNIILTAACLESLVVHLDGTQITDSGIIRFFSSLIDTSDNVEYLEVSLADTKVTKKSIKFFINSTFLTMKKLKTLVFNLQGTDIEKRELTNVLIELKKHDREDFDFRVEFGDSQLTKKDFENLQVMQEEEEDEDEDEDHEEEEQQEEGEEEEKEDEQKDIINMHSKQGHLLSSKIDRLKYEPVEQFDQFDDGLDDILNGHYVFSANYLDEKNLEKKKSGVPFDIEYMKPSISEDPYNQKLIGISAHPDSDDSVRYSDDFEDYDYEYEDL